jgi:hypothetical protein
MKHSKLGRFTGGLHYAPIPIDMVRKAQLEKGSTIRIEQTATGAIVIERAVVA